MTKKVLRKLRVDGRAYLWYRQHAHTADSGCRETLTIFLDGRKVSSLRIRFQNEGEQPGPDSGCWIVCPDQGGLLRLPDGPRLNLNMPSLVELLLRHGLGLGWDPRGQKKPTELENGLEILDELDLVSKGVV